MNKYVKTDGIELNKENLPIIFDNLINNSNIRNIEVDVDVGFLEIMNDETCSRFQFGTQLQITEEWVYKAKNSNKEYTACFLYSIHPINWLNKLYDSNNVVEFTLNRKTKEVTICTKEKVFSVYTDAVIVFDEDDNFVEVFECNARTMVGAMLEHGYTKVEE